MIQIKRLYTKERFERLRSKFALIDKVAEKIISKATSKDILLLQITINDSRKVVSAQITSPNEYLKSCVL